LIADAIDYFWEVASGVVLGDTAGILETIAVQPTRTLSTLDADAVPCGGTAVAIEFADTVLNGRIATSRGQCSDAAGLGPRTIRIAVFIGLVDAEPVPAGGTTIEVLTADAFFHTAVSTPCAAVGNAAVALGRHAITKRDRIRARVRSAIGEGTCIEAIAVDEASHQVFSDLKLEGVGVLQTGLNASIFPVGTLVGAREELGTGRCIAWGITIIERLVDTNAIPADRTAEGVLVADAILYRINIASGGVVFRTTIFCDPWWSEAGLDQGPAEILCTPVEVLVFGQREAAIYI
jgi:hypothetical protein